MAGAQYRRRRSSLNVLTSWMDYCTFVQNLSASTPGVTATSNTSVCHRKIPTGFQTASSHGGCDDKASFTREEYKIRHMDLDYRLTKQNELIITLDSAFLINRDPPSTQEVINRIHPHPGIKTIAFNADKLKQWDSSLVNLVLRLHRHCEQNNITLVPSGLPQGVHRLFLLATASPDNDRDKKELPPSTFLQRTGTATLTAIRNFLALLAFIGEVFSAFLTLVRGRGSIRGSVFLPVLMDCTAGALPIVSLISCLVGLILAFVGAVQLVMFGAQIYVASLVGIAMVRVMGAVMAGVIMAGRTGAAFAAQLGTMEVNEEIDALKTLGINPIEFLVIPRVLALTIAMPLLCVYADLMGIIGGLVVGIFMLDLNFMEYFNMTRASVGLNSFWIGLFQSMVFGVLVALAGCLKGMQCSRSASAVGKATTGAVVSGIVAIVVATATITLLCNILGI